MLIAHLSDSHLGYRQYGLIERERDIYACFEEAVDKAIEEHVDAVIHSGDLFHSPNPPPQAYRSALRALRRLKQKGIPFLYIMGQHDKPKMQAIPPLTIFEDMELLRHVSEKPYSHNEFSVVGVDHLRRDLLKSRLQELKPPTRNSVLMLHVLLKEVSPLGDVSLYELPTGFRYFALGDYHIFKSLKTRGGVAVYPGSSEIISLNDLTEAGKGFCIADLSKDEVTVAFQKLESVRPRIVLDVDANKIEEAASKLISQASSMNTKPLIHLTVRGVGVKRRGLDQIRDELSKVSLRAFISIEEGPLTFQGGKRFFSDIESVIQASIPNIGCVILDIYKAFKAGNLHDEIERLLKTGEWTKWSERPSEVEQKASSEASRKSSKPKDPNILEWVER
ncbi:MAG: DNA repair exonuclease [Candidatus Nezhaarchaeota archaeon]|nr:DNA repair exonuclease [Candidatus Nezhaarchaeota archaeon]